MITRAIRPQKRYLISDAIMSYLGVMLFNVCRYYLLPHTVSHISLLTFLCSDKILLETVIIPIPMMGIYWLSGFYHNPYERSRIQDFFTTFLSSILITLLIFFSLLTNDQASDLRANFLLLTALFSCVFFPLFIGRYLITSSTFRHIRRREWQSNTLIIGSSDTARKQGDLFNKISSIYGYKVVAYVSLPGETEGSPTPLPVYQLNEIAEACRKHNIEQCIVVPEKNDENALIPLLPRLFELDIPIKLAADNYSIVTSSIRLTDIFSEPFVDITSPSLSASGQNIKRLLDIIFSTIALILLALPMLIVAIRIKLDSPGPVFYSQERLGYKKRPFRIYKFRTMRTDAEKDGPRLSSTDDPRITKVGRVLRKYRIDELPQFWNVLKGDMSLVGPRPERQYFAEKILEKAPYYILVHQVRPGITSWGMVKYGYASTIDEMVRRAKYDIIYLSNMSLLIDTKILIYTIKTVLTGRGL